MQRSHPSIQSLTTYQDRTGHSFSIDSGMVAAHAVERRDQHAHAVGHRDAHLCGNLLRGPADQLRDWAAAAASRAPRRARRPRPARGTSRRWASNCRRASSATASSTTTELGDEHSRPLSKRLAQDDVARRAGHVGAALDVARRVAGADAVGRLAGAVGRAHQAHAAGGQDHGHVALPHQLLRAFERDGLHPADRSRRRAGARGGLGHDLHRSRDAPRRRRVRADDDRAARLQGDQHLVDRGGRGVGGRDDGGHDAERLGDLDDLLVLDAG